MRLHPALHPALHQALHPALHLALHQALHPVRHPAHLVVSLRVFRQRVISRQIAEGRQNLQAMNRQVVPSLQSYRVKCHRAALGLQTFPLNLIHLLKALNLQALQAPVSLPLLNQAILPVAVLERVLAVDQVKLHPLNRRSALSLVQSQVDHRLVNQVLAVNQVKHHPIPRRYPLSLLQSRVCHRLLNQVLAVNQVKHLLQNQVYHHLLNQAVLPVQVGLRVNPHQGL